MLTAGAPRAHREAGFMSNSHMPAGRATEQLVTRLRALPPEGVVDRDRAIWELVGHTYNRLTEIVQNLFGRFYALHRVLETGDVLDQAVLRLRQDLQRKGPESAGEYYAWSSRTIRNTIIDL